MRRFPGHAKLVVQHSTTSRSLCEGRCGEDLTKHEGARVIAVSCTHEERCAGGVRANIRHGECLLRRDTDDSLASKIDTASNVAALQS
jgi:hypothetical protein